MSFWYGLPYREIRHEMPFAAIQAYMQKLQARQAELRLMMGEAAEVPWMKKEDRRQWARELGRQLTDGQPVRRARVVSPAILASRGILVKRTE